MAAYASSGAAAGVAAGGDSVLWRLITLKNAAEFGSFDANFIPEQYCHLRNQLERRG